MDPGADAPEEAQPSGSGDPAPAAEQQLATPAPSQQQQQPSSSSLPQQQQQQQPSRYESQKRRDWNTFLQYLKNHKPPLTLARCCGANVIEFLKYLDQFGKTKVHNQGCNYFGHPNPPAPCVCPLKQAWGSLDALIGRLRAAYEESGGKPESNPFGAKAVRIYLREVRQSQAKARGIPYEKKKKKRKISQQPTTSTAATTAPTVTITTSAADQSSSAATPEPEPEPEPAGASTSVAAAGGGNGDHVPTPTPTPPPPLLPPSTASSS